MVELIAVSCFGTQEDDELTLQIGDIIKNSKCTEEEGWWEGEKNGKRGRFPRIFVEEVPSHTVESGHHIQPRSVRRKKAVKRRKQRWCEVIISYSPVKSEELELKLGDIIEILDEIEDGWWVGRKNGKTGSFPSNFVMEMDNTEGKFQGPITKSAFSLQNQGEPGSDLQDPTFRSAHPNEDLGDPGVGRQQAGKEYCKAVFDYLAGSEDELSLHIGDVILVLEKETGEYGWWEGYVDGNQGLFPDNYVIPYLEDTEVKKGLPPRVRTDVDVYEKNEPTSEWSEPAVKPNMLPPRKVPPPVKVKPVLGSLPNKVSGEQAVPPQEQSKPARDRTSDSDSVTFDTLAGPTERLKHPTTDRPKPKGRRPPSQFVASPAQDVKRSPRPATTVKVTALTTQLSETPPCKKLQSTAVKPGTVLPSSSNKLQREAEREDKATSLVELRADVRSLQLSLDLLKNLHLRDITDLKEEIAEERTKRNALQVEVEKLKKSLTNL
ncbi:SH3 domain-containing protein 21 isoform X4 [Cetorhinus maximus]